MDLHKIRTQEALKIIVVSGCQMKRYYVTMQEANEAVCRMMHDCFRSGDEEMDAIAVTFNELPTAQATLYGYSIDHLALIADVMEKEGVSPEEVVQFFNDTQRIYQMLVDEIQK